MHQPPSAKNNACTELGTCKKFDKKQQTLAPKCQVYHLLCAWDFEYALSSHKVLVSCRLSLSRRNPKSPTFKKISNHNKTSKAKDELTSALATMEKLKESFKNDRPGWDTERSTLLKRAEVAETALKPISAELTGLKQQINAMTAAVFGKQPPHKI